MLRAWDDWHDASWDEAEAAWKARSTADLLRYGQIAELHAVHRLGAAFPDRVGRTPTAGFDVLHDGCRIEVKAKEPSVRPRAQLYVQPQLAKRHGSDRFWFYIFGHAVDDVEVWEAATRDVFANLSVRNGTAITLSRVEKIGRLIWSDGADRRGDGVDRRGN